MNLGIQTISDNWLLQNCVELLNRKVDPMKEGYWFFWDHKSGNLIEKEISFGAIGVQACATLLEQLVFCDSIYVLKDWVDTWRGEHKTLDALLDLSLIKMHNGINKDNKLKKIYMSEICHKPYVAKAVEIAGNEFRKGTPTYFGQVVNGALGYLALAEDTSYAYCPHPVRAKYLENELYLHSNWPYKSITKFEKIIENTKLKLIKKETNDTAVVTLTMRMSSVSLYCLMNSSETVDPIDTAIQLRKDKKFRQLRAVLHEMQLACQSDPELYIKKGRLLEKAIDDVERRLGVRDMSEKDGFSQLDILGYPVKIPYSLRIPLLRPLHSSAIYRMLVANIKDLRDALNKCFGIKNDKIIKDMVAFTATKD